MTRDYLSQLIESFEDAADARTTRRRVAREYIEPGDLPERERATSSKHIRIGIDDMDEREILEMKRRHSR